MPHWKLEQSKHALFGHELIAIVWQVRMILKGTKDFMHQCWTCHFSLYMLVNHSWSGQWNPMYLGRQHQSVAKVSCTDAGKDGVPSWIRNPNHSSSVTKAAHNFALMLILLSQTYLSKIWWCRWSHRCMGARSMGVRSMGAPNLPSVAVVHRCSLLLLKSHGLLQYAIWSSPCYYKEFKHCVIDSTTASTLLKHKIWLKSALPRFPVCIHLYISLNKWHICCCCCCYMIHCHIQMIMCVYGCDRFCSLSKKWKAACCSWY